MARRGDVSRFGVRTPEQVRKDCAKGGRNSGKTRRALGDAKSVVQLILGQACPDRLRQIVKRLFPFLTDEEINYRVLLVSKKFQNGLNGKSSDIDWLFELADEGPSKKQQIDLTSSDGSMSPHATPEQTALKFAEMMDKINAEQSQ